MFRLLGHVLPDKKAIWIALTYIYGIGRSRSRQILEKLGIPLEKKVGELTDEEKRVITEELANYTLENDLKREVAAAIKRLKEIRCYRGMRHSLGLPVRGQKTRKNAKTAKKLLGRSKVRPILKK